MKGKIKIILLKDIKDIGKTNDVINVSNGYFFNFLQKNKIAKKFIEINQLNEKKINNSSKKSEIDSIKNKLENNIFKYDILFDKKTQKPHHELSYKKLEKDIKKIVNFDFPKKIFIAKRKIVKSGKSMIKIRLENNIIAKITVNITKIYESK